MAVPQPQLSALLQAAQSRAIIDRPQALAWARCLANAAASGVHGLAKAIDGRKRELPQAAQLASLLPSAGDPPLLGRWNRLARVQEGALGSSWLVVAPDSALALARVLPSALFAAAGSGEAWLAARRSELQAPQHPHLVPVIDAGLEADGPVVVRQWEQAIDWQQRLVRKGPCDEARALAYTAHAASGVAALHAAGRVHGGLKPGNVLVCSQCRVRLADAGLARDSLGRLLPGLSPDRLGTLKWCAPECLDGDPGEPRSDIYALGCLLYFLLTGRPPYSGSTQEVAARHRNAQRPDVRRYAPQISVRTARLIYTALRIKPEKRHAGALALLHELRQAHRALAAKPSDAPATLGDGAETLNLITPPSGNAPVV